MPDSTISKKILSLAEAVEKTGCTVQDLLDLGGVGKIKIGVKVPDEIIVFDIDLATRELENKKIDTLVRSRLISQLNGYEPNERPEIRVLFLGSQDCKNIRAGRLDSKSLFADALRVREDGCYEKISTPKSTPAPIHGLGGSPSIGKRLFATYLKTIRGQVPIRWALVDRTEVLLTTDNLCVISEDLHLYIKTNIVNSGEKLSSRKSTTNTANTTKNNGQRNAKKQRTRDNILTPILIEALMQVKDKTNAELVWGKLLEMTKNQGEIYPLLPYGEKNIIEYQKNNSRLELTVDSVRRRIGTINRRNVDE